MSVHCATRGYEGEQRLNHTEVNWEHVWRLLQGGELIIAPVPPLPPRETPPEQTPQTLRNILQLMLAQTHHQQNLNGPDVSGNQNQSATQSGRKIQNKACSVAPR